MMHQKALRIMPLLVLCMVFFIIASSDHMNAATKVEGKLNINTATVSEFVLLPGIGPNKAATIIAYREENGPFEKIEDMINVKGIGRRTLQKLEAYLKLDGESDLHVEVITTTTKQDAPKTDPKSEEGTKK
ncbi:MAG: hypothetical protein A2161_03225 [Candidatus Schekmanbacteria bacterium RBG_13_48_7]|uniref:Competence protein ComEA n=1 Tax=Candidatus Schekmanbacteria bacterium RBG_13_48_7 TaxID=1817878 RepID=A0A1F7RRP7_9BACT|nr:MAG: hypothetical protein A2161_03225 [Candidatus Schekmanbacteria bacterium RBG_13_48_7]